MSGIVRIICGIGFIVLAIFYAHCMTVIHEIERMCERWEKWK